MKKHNNNNNNNKVDIEKENKIESLCYPELEEVVKTEWSRMIHKYQPLSKTFVKWRIINEFSKQYSKLPSPSDILSLTTLTHDLLTHHSIAPEFITHSDLLTLTQTLSSGMNISVCAVIGGCLAQEIIKVISHVGKPMFNVFVFSAEDSIGRSFSTVINN
mmetsp:Transcript_6926/g.7172  ORF Transcript_6926/g.7172 Transcript_6926/m.7172 type:complete len:160 (+) Transcript_6926:458-937(+)